jgi:hypothetical protein
MIISAKRALRLAECARYQFEHYKEQGMLACAKYILLKGTTMPDKLSDEEKTLDLGLSERIVRDFIQHLLDNDLFEAAATLMWGRDVFDYRPQSVRDVWRCARDFDKLLIPGSGAQGKTFSVGARFYLEWWLDPEYTCIKVISATKEHAKTNIFASMQNFHRWAIIRPAGCEDREAAESIKCNNDEKQGIHLVAIAKGESGTGVLRGFHPTPRNGDPHPRFGVLSRVFVLLDEAEVIPGGVWEGVNNIASTIDTSMHKGQIKICAASNPKNRASHFGQQCEPTGGWTTINVDSSHEWDSKSGFHVLRLDAARSENVVQKKIVYPGFQSYEGYMAYIQAGGRTAEAMTFARGWFPEEGVAMCIITPAMFDNSIGTLRFIGSVIPLCAFDLALEGNDTIVCSYGRFGLSDGWTRPSGEFINFKEPRVSLQLDSQIKFPKGDTVKTFKAIKDFCRDMKIKPAWVCLDRTGNGAGVHDCLRNDIHFAPDVMGVNFSEAATETKIFTEDAKTCEEEYKGIWTELLFALSRYLEFGYLKISPSFRNEELIKQGTGRRYRQVGVGLVQAQSKKDYMRDTGSKSPDELDSLSLFVHLFRMKSGEVGSMAEERVPERRESYVNFSVIDDIQFINFAEDY